MRKIAFRIAAGGNLQGNLRVPGDKSISHRAILFASIAEGNSVINGLLRGEDVLYTMAAMRELGIHFEEDGKDQVIVHGGKLRRKANAPIYLGNSGTGARLLAGLLGGYGIDCQLIGDESLSRRPMGRIIEPLRRMGVNIMASATQTLPLTLAAHQGIKAIDYTLPIASAQVKSCLLLAGLNAQGITCIREPTSTRNHSELMLGNFSVDVAINDENIRLVGGQKLTACSIDVPSDISAAAFFMVAACLLSDSDLTLENVCINPTRDGIIQILKQMQANIDIHNPRLIGGEKVADIRVRTSQLQGIDIDPSLVASAIDEFPILFVAASQARGITRLRQAEELRHKESDRLASMATALQQCGVKLTQFADGIDIHGGKLTAPKQVIDANHDHRIAMAMAVAAATLPAGEMTIHGCETVYTSFPEFDRVAASIGMHISRC